MVDTDPSDPVPPRSAPFPPPLPAPQQLSIPPTIPMADLAQNGSLDVANAPTRSSFRRGLLVGALVASLLLGSAWVITSALHRSAERQTASPATATVPTLATSPTPATTTTIAATTSSAASGSSVAPASPQRWVMGNYPWYERDEVTPAEFPYEKVTHVSIGPAVLESSIACCLASPEDDAATWRAFENEVIVRAHRAGRKVMLQLGGADGNANKVWNAATATAESTSVIAGQMVAYARAHSYDGLELDWEESVDMARVTLLSQVIRTDWPDAVISVDLGTTQDNVSWAPALAAVVDRLNVMTYQSIGNWGGWDGPWHQGAMYENADHSLNRNHAYSVDRSVQQLLRAGTPAAKIGIGLGLFGTGYGDSNHRAGCPTSPRGWADEKGFIVSDHQLTLAMIERLYAPFMTKHVDDVSQTPWLSAPSPGAGGDKNAEAPKLCYISYEDPDSAAVKATYINDHGLGGIILWAVPQDRRANGHYPVLDALNAGLRS